MRRLRRRAWVLAIAATLYPFAAEAAFELTLVSGFGPGGGDVQAASGSRKNSGAARPRPVYDLTIRLYARHLGRFLPPRVTVAMKHMPGAGSLRAARWLYTQAPARGVVAGTVAGSALRHMIIHGEVRPERRFVAIGGRAGGEYVCARRRYPGRSGAYARTTLFGATAPRERSFVHARALAATGKLKLRLISGYSNSTHLALAFRRMEIDGFCGLGSSAIFNQLGDLAANGSLVPIVRFAVPGRGIMRGVPRIAEIASARSAVGAAALKQLRAALQVLEWQGHVDFALLAPPGTSDVRATALRMAYGRMMQDGRFRRDAVRWGLQVDPVGWQAVAQALDRMARLGPGAAVLLNQWLSRRGR